LSSGADDERAVMRAHRVLVHSRRGPMTSVQSCALTAYWCTLVGGRSRVCSHRMGWSSVGMVRPMTHEEILDDLSEPSRALRNQIPEVFAGYSKMTAAAFADGMLDAKTKELIALAIS